MFGEFDKAVVSINALNETVRTLVTSITILTSEIEGLREGIKACQIVQNEIKE